MMLFIAVSTQQTPGHKYKCKVTRHIVMHSRFCSAIFFNKKNPKTVIVIAR